MTDAKKVLIVVTKSNFGGAQRYCLDLARECGKRGIDVSVSHGVEKRGASGALASLLIAENIRSIPLPSLGRNIHPLRDISALKELLALFKKERPDIVHLNSSKAGGLGAFAARIAGIPRIIFTLHGFPGDEARNPFVRALIATATWLTIMAAHTTITLSTHDYERMRRFPLTRRKIVLIRNGIETPSFLSERDARKELRTLAPTLPEDGLWIGSIGELHKNKDHASLIRALARVPDAHLVLMGEGEERSALEAAARAIHLADRVHLIGFVPEAARYLRAYDCFALSSLKEGLPYVLLEAGCAYVPVVATRVGGIPDIIIHDFTGILVPPRDPEALGDALQRMLSDATLSRSLSEELLKRVRHSFSFEEMVEKTLAAYWMSSASQHTARRD